MCVDCLTGEVTTFAGPGNVGSLGLSNVAQFSYPGGIAISNNTSDLYVCDHSNHRIRKITTEGKVHGCCKSLILDLYIGNVSTFAGSGTAGYGDGHGSSVSFHYPWGIDINQTDGCLYIIDYSNHKIRKITPQGFMFLIQQPNLQNL